MKKLFQSSKFRLHLLRAARRELNRRRLKRTRGATVDTYAVKFAAIMKRKLIRLTPPPIFSIIDNPQAMISFLSVLSKQAQRYPIYVDMTNVTSVRPDGVAAFLAVMQSVQPSAIRGNQPRLQDSADNLRAYGFFDHVQGVASLASQKGQVWNEHAGTRVDPEMCARYARFGRACSGHSLVTLKPSVATLLEVTANTFAHAEPKRPGSVRWWAGVHYDSNRKKLCFTVVDQGVGVYRSKGVVSMIREAKWVPPGFDPQSNLLRNMMEGKVKSRTGKRHRGRGLPGAVAQFRAGRFGRLVIVSDRAYVDCDKQYRDLAVSFGGTLVYWEV